MRVFIFLTATLFLCALSQVTSSNRARSLFIAIGKQEQTQNTLEINYKQLQLERTALARHNHIDEVAKKNLGMISITPKDTTYIRWQNNKLEVLHSVEQ